MARLLNRPKLLDPVRRNLDMNVFYMHPDCEIETVGSRRQDQLMTSSIASYYSSTGIWPSRTATRCMPMWSG